MTAYSYLALSRDRPYHGKTAVHGPVPPHGYYPHNLSTRHPHPYAKQRTGPKNQIAISKVAPPFKEAEFDIMYGQGISTEGDVLDLAVEHKLVQKSGSWFSYGDQRLGQGRENVRQFLRDNPELVVRLRREVIQAVNPEWNTEGGVEGAEAEAAEAVQGVAETEGVAETAQAE